MSRAGQAAGQGRYQCHGCGRIAHLPHSSAELPVCPACKGESYMPEAR